MRILIFILTILIPTAALGQEGPREHVWGFPGEDDACIVSDWRHYDLNAHVYTPAGAGFATLESPPQDFTQMRDVGDCWKLNYLNDGNFEWRYSTSCPAAQFKLSADMVFIFPTAYGETGLQWAVGSTSDVDPGYRVSPSSMSYPHSANKRARIGADAVTTIRPGQFVALMLSTGANVFNTYEGEISFTQVAGCDSSTVTALPFSEPDPGPPVGATGLILGDSLSDDGQPCYASEECAMWSEQMQTDPTASGFTSVANLATSGLEMEEYAHDELNNWDSAIAPAITSTVSVILMLSANDASLKHHATRYRDSTTKFVNKILAENPAELILVPAPRFITTQPEKNHHSESYYWVIQEVCARPDVRCGWDTWDVMQDDALYGDTTHPNANGHNAIYAEAVAYFATPATKLVWGDTFSRPNSGDLTANCRGEGPGGTCEWETIYPTSSPLSNISSETLDFGDAKGLVASSIDTNTTAQFAGAQWMGAKQDETAGRISGPAIRLTGGVDENYYAFIQNSDTDFQLVACATDVVCPLLYQFTDGLDYGNTAGQFSDLREFDSLGISADDGIGDAIVFTVWKFDLEAPPTDFKEWDRRANRKYTLCASGCDITWTYPPSNAGGTTDATANTGKRIGIVNLADNSNAWDNFVGGDVD